MILAFSTKNKFRHQISLNSRYPQKVLKFCGTILFQKKNDIVSLSEVSSVHFTTTTAIRKNNNYSATWQSVDKDLQSRQTSNSKLQHDESKFHPPDPLHYLSKLDSLSTIQPYRTSLLNALDLTQNPHDLVLDVGCGLGGGITHNEISKQLKGPGHLLGVDISERLLQGAIRKSQNGNYSHNTSYQLADAYNLPFRDESYNVSMADRVFQHMIRPFDALQEMIRVTKRDGLIVIADPDFRTFQIDVTGAGCNHRYDSHTSYASHQYQENYNAEAGRRWASSERPPAHLQFDMGGLTTKILNYVIPTLSAHSYMGMAQPRLLRSAGLNNIQMEIVPVILQGRSDLENVVPITYMTQLAVDNSNGDLTRKEADLWLQRLEWEGNDYLFGSLNFYITRAVRPMSAIDIDTSNRRNRNRIMFGTPIALPLGEGGGNQQTPVIEPAEIITCRFAHPDKDVALIHDAERLINNEYAYSDTGITLCSGRLDKGDAMVFASHQELILALDKDTGELLGTIQIKIKDNDNDHDNDINTNDQDSGNNNSKGLPNLSGTDQIAEFTCFAVRSGKTYEVRNIKTLDVSVKEIPPILKDHYNHDTIHERDSHQKRGVGAALVRYAEAHCQAHGCTKMQLAIVCPDVPPEKEPTLKQWLQNYYKKLGYEYHSSIGLEFVLDEDGNVVRDELHEMYKSLMQLVKCKAIVMQKCL